MRYLLLFSLTLIAFSCKDKEYTEPEVQPEQITGIWQLQAVSFNGVDGNNLSPTFEPATTMNVSPDNTYWRNYVTGNWEIDQLTIRFLPNAELSAPGLQFEFVSATTSELTLKLKLTEAQYRWDFEEFNEDQELEIIEVYKRVE